MRVVRRAEIGMDLGNELVGVCLQRGAGDENKVGKCGIADVFQMS